MKYLFSFEKNPVMSLAKDEFYIALSCGGSTYAAPMPLRGDDVEKLKDGLIGMIAFINKKQTEEHDAECKGKP